MLLLIDIGNSNITIGLCDNGIKEVSRVISGRGDRDIDEYSLLLRGVAGDYRDTGLEGAVVSSVVPRITPLIMRALKKNFRIKPLIVSHKIKTGLKLRVKYPGKLGTDRIATAVGARSLYRGNLTVIDFGTATTFCSVSSSGEYRPGPIIPGLGISADILKEKTAQLPGVNLMLPMRVSGERTEENIRAGLILGHAGGTERIIREMQKASGIKTVVVATGGYAERLAPYIKMIKFVNPLLTLEGLRVIFRLNQ